MKMTEIRRYAARLSAAALCFAALSTAPMLAQGGGGGGRPQMSPADQTAAVDKAVGLTADQKTKITAIFADQQKQMTALRSSGGDPADMRPKMMALRSATQNKIKALLTAAQKPKYDAYLAAQPQGRGGGGGAPPQN